MNLTKIRILLEKFYDGESTLEEENQLIIFFSSEDIPESLESDKKLFLSMKCKDSDIKVPDDLNDNISDFIDELTTQDKQENKIKRVNLFTTHVRIFSIAASIIILFGIGWFINDNNTKPKDTFTNPIEAYNETQRILSYVASNLKNGEKAMAISEEKIGKVKKAFQGNITLE